MQIPEPHSGRHNPELGVSACSGIRIPTSSQTTHLQSSWHKCRSQSVASGSSRFPAGGDRGGCLCRGRCWSQVKKPGSLRTKATQSMVAKTGRGIRISLTAQSLLLTFQLYSLSLLPGIPSVSETVAVPQSCHSVCLWVTFCLAPYCPNVMVISHNSSAEPI